MRSLTFAALIGLAGTAGAKQSVVERPIGAVIATTAAGMVTYPAGVFRVLANGSIVLGGASVRLIDSTLSRVTIMMDTASEQAPSMPMGITLPETNMRPPRRRYTTAPFPGDSTVVVGSDAVSLSLFGPLGTFAREFAMPFGEFPNVVDATGSLLAMDSRSRLIMTPPIEMGSSRLGINSVFLVRVTYGRRAVDTLARLGVNDVWGVLSDGTILIVRSTCMLESMTVDGRWQIGMAQGCANPRSGIALADRAQHLWLEREVSPEERREKGDLYDVIDRSGRIVDRVRIASPGPIIGFTENAVYLRTASGIEKRSLR